MSVQLQADRKVMPANETETQTATAGGESWPPGPGPLGPGRTGQPAPRPLRRRSAVRPGSRRLRNAETIGDLDFVERHQLGSTQAPVYYERLDFAVDDSSRARYDLQKEPRDRGALPSYVEAAGDDRLCAKGGETCRQPRFRVSTFNSLAT